MSSDSLTKDPKAIFEQESGKNNSNNFTLRNSIPAYALAALPLVSPVPIQDVQLFDYTVAHKSVNSSYGLTANANDEIYIIGKDPYTSDQQRSVKLTDGVVKDITNLSGHYLPNPGEAMNFLRVFKNAGVNVDQSFLSIYKENGTIFKQVHITANARKLYE